MNHAGRQWRESKHNKSSQGVKAPTHSFPFPLPQSHSAISFQSTHLLSSFELFFMWRRIAQCRSLPRLYYASLEPTKAAATLCYTNNRIMQTRVMASLSGRPQIPKGFEKFFDPKQPGNNNSGNKRQDDKDQLPGGGGNKIPWLPIALGTTLLWWMTMPSESAHEMTWQEFKTKLLGMWIYGMDGSFSLTHTCRKGIGGAFGCSEWYCSTCLFTS